MKSLAIAILLFAMTASAAFAQTTALEFPSNEDWPQGDIFAFEFDNPAGYTPGLPFYGTAVDARDQGATYLWEFKPEPIPTTTRFAVTFFYSQGDNAFGDAQFFGAHPYPAQMGNTTPALVDVTDCVDYPFSLDAHTGSGLQNFAVWELSNGFTGNTGDDLKIGTEGSEVSGARCVETGRWHHQAVTVSFNSPTASGVFFYDLKNGTGNNYRIENSGTDMADVTSFSPTLYWGDAPWHSGLTTIERMNGQIRNIKVINALMTDAEIQTEIGCVGDGTECTGNDALTTTIAQNEVWYHRANFGTPAAGGSGGIGIEDESGNNNDPLWVDTAKLPTLIEIAPATPVPTFLGTLITGGSIQ